LFAFISWYIIITLTGWLAFPLAYRLLPALADRGYAISRALGLILWGYMIWLLASLGILKFTSGSLLLTLALLLSLSLWALRTIDLKQIRQWIMAQSKYILAVEALFLVSFGAWTLVRAANPEAMGTEKPMELAFINAILNSPNFPPHDPWLSGYAISYYYFGYVLVSILAKISQTSAGIAFNLGSALIFAMSTVGAYGLVYNLIKTAQARAEASEKSLLKVRATLSALLGPLFLLIVSNLEGFLHSLHTRGLFWSKDIAGALTSNFWRWLDIKDLNIPPTEPFSWAPTRFWWWWRASRVVQDYDLSGAPREIINEFPFFSFLLADLHPHVLALPFALLAMSLALNLILGGASGKFRWLKLKTLDIDPFNFMLLVVVSGGIAFLNTWDLPAHLALMGMAYILQQSWLGNKSWSQLLVDFAWFTGLLAVSSIVIYLPFYLGFASQAGGILPNLIYPTRGAHLWVMFAPFLIPLLGYFMFLGRKMTSRRWLKTGLLLTAGLFFSLFLFALLLGYLITLIPEASSIYLGSLAAPDYPNLLRAAFSRRLENPGGWITLLVFLALNLGLLSTQFQKTLPANLIEEKTQSLEKSEIPVQTYLLTIAAIGALLVTAPEFVYLRDQFGWRMNTIFKFYYQAWLLWSIAAAVAVVFLLARTSGIWRLLTWLGTGILVWMSLFYPVFSLDNKTNSFNPATWTLDGTAYLRQQSPEEMNAIDWLLSAPDGIVAEAVPATGGSYTQYGRVAILSGKPSVLGWMGHESQWRGGNEAMGSRQSDLESLYCSRSWEETFAILEKYQIRYIFLGDLERSTYQPGVGNCPYGIVEIKFVRNLALVYESDQTLIYEYSGQALNPQ
jgi:YYY domain-containing protein